MTRKWISSWEISQLKDEEKLKAVWNNIYYFKEKEAEEKKKEQETKENKEKKIKKKKSRRKKIPLEICYNINKLSNDKTISSIASYETKLADNYYIVDIIETSDKQFYVRLSDAETGIEVDFDKFKEKHMQPNLFDFFDI